MEVPTLAPAQLRVVADQAPHKVLAYHLLSAYDAAKASER